MNIAANAKSPPAAKLERNTRGSPTDGKSLAFKPYETNVVTRKPSDEGRPTSKASVHSVSGQDSVSCSDNMHLDKKSSGNRTPVSRKSASPSGQATATATSGTPSADRKTPADREKTDGSPRSNSSSNNSSSSSNNNNNNNSSNNNNNNNNGSLQTRSCRILGQPAVLSTRAGGEPGLQATVRRRVALLASSSGRGSAARCLPVGESDRRQPVLELRPREDSSRRRGAGTGLQGSLLHRLSVQYAQCADHDGRGQLSERMHPVRSSKVRAGDGAVVPGPDAAPVVVVSVHAGERRATLRVQLDRRRVVLRQAVRHVGGAAAAPA